MKTEHTPGPWKACTGWVGAGPANTVPTRVICRVEGYPYGETEANLNVIATAPELLALAKHILALETDPYLQGHPEWEAFLNEAKAAENKAEGRKS